MLGEKLDIYIYTRSAVFFIQFFCAESHRRHTDTHTETPPLM